MSPNDEQAYQQRIAQLEAENARLRHTLDEVKADRRQLAEQVYGPVPDKYRPTEEEVIEAMRNHVPGSGLKWLTEIGSLPEEADVIPDPAPPFELGVSGRSANGSDG